MTADRERPASFTQTVIADLTHAAALWDRPPARAAVAALIKLAFYPRVRAVLYFRVSQTLWRRPTTRPLALLLQGHTQRMSGAEIHPAASIGPGLNLVHSDGVVIGSRTQVGPDARLYQQVTLGDNGWEAGQPTIGRKVVLGAGCKVLGSITVGDRVVIGANVVVVRDVPPDSVVVGARSEIRPRSGPGPAASDR